MTFKASVSRNACSIPDAIVFAATASPKARALRVTPSPFRALISHGLIAAAPLKTGRPDVGVEPKESSHGDVCWIRRVAQGNQR